MDSRTAVIIWLSLQILGMSVVLVRDAHRIGYLEGQQAGTVVTIGQPESDGTYPGYKWVENKPTDEKRKGLHKSKTGVH